METYVADKKVYDATVASAKTLNDAIEAASTELKKSGATVTTSSQVVHTVDEVNTLTASNNQKIATAQAKIKENTAKQEAYNTTKAESDKTNTDASQKADELKKLVKFILFPRNDGNANKEEILADLRKKGYNFERMKTETYDVSSTGIRAEIAQKRSLAGLVLPETEEFINENGLYEN